MCTGMTVLRTMFFDLCHYVGAIMYCKAGAVVKADESFGRERVYKNQEFCGFKSQNS